MSRLDETYNFYYYHLERKVLIRPNNAFRTERKIYFRPGRKGFHDINISSDCDITYFVYSYRKNYERIYFVFHFVITQDKKNPCVICGRQQIKER
jgi:hypothetical protein